MTKEQAVSLLHRAERLLNHLDASLCYDCRESFPDLRPELNEITIALTQNAAQQAQEAAED